MLRQIFFVKLYEAALLTDGDVGVQPKGEIYENKLLTFLSEVVLIEKGIKMNLATLSCLKRFNTKKLFYRSPTPFMIRQQF